METAHDQPVLDPGNVMKRKLLLGELQAALSEAGIPCILASRHRLVLRYNTAPLPRSGPTDPTLHAFGPDGTRIVSTDGTAYRLDDGQQFPAADPTATAAAICRALEPVAAARRHSAPPAPLSMTARPAVMPLLP